MDIRIHNHDRSTNDERVLYDPNSFNGFLLNGVQLPTELLNMIFLHVEVRSLLSCQAVCKIWNILMRDYVWRKRAKWAVGRSLPLNQDLPWYLYFILCVTNTFERNLIINPSGEWGLLGWRDWCDNPFRWFIEDPPRGVPDLPNDPVFEGKKCCFATSDKLTSKIQEIDLVQLGLIPELLDNVQPPIIVRDWYCRQNEIACYHCLIFLVNADNVTIDSYNVVTRRGKYKLNTWMRVSHIFKNYGPGLRKARFTHGSLCLGPPIGQQFCKLAGSYLYIVIPDSMPRRFRKPRLSVQYL